MHYFRAAVYACFGIGVLAILAPLMIQRMVPMTQELGWFRFAGVPLGMLGAAMYATCWWDFARRGGTPAFWEPPGELIVNIWFRRMRNPMYVGVVLMILGPSVWLGSIGLAAYTVIVALGFHVFVVCYEEPHLSRTFGKPYHQYCRRVPRWLPREAPVLDITSHEAETP